MSLIINLVKEIDKKESKSNPDNGTGCDQKPRPIIKSALDLQRLKLEKLMKNPDKQAVIPEPRREKDYMQSVPSFVRNVMGSSAGAGSGEFHVYRHLRRKEYARQKMIQNKSAKELLDDEYQNKLEENRKSADEKTAKKRAKRLKKKQNAKRPKQQKPHNEVHRFIKDESSSDESAQQTVSEIPQQEIDTNLSLTTDDVEGSENKTAQSQEASASVECS